MQYFKEMIQLITRLNNPERQWPAVPKDSESVELLKEELICMVALGGDTCVAPLLIMTRL